MKKQLGVVVLTIIIAYMYILKKNNLLFQKNTKPIESIIDHDNSVLFEITELLVLGILIYHLYKQKQYVLCAIFILELIEHFNELLFCFRQTDSLHALTILLDITFMVYAYYTKCFWILPFFMIGIIIHIIPMYYKKSLVDIVCIT
jgi:hypothetical protein